MPRIFLVPTLMAAVFLSPTVSAKAEDASESEQVQIDETMWAAFKAREESLRRTAMERLEKATVWVVGVEDGEIQNSGSGFFVANGVVMTNAHVAGYPNRDFYVMNHHMPVTKVEVVAIGDPKLNADYALLYFDPPENFDPPVLAFSTEIKRLDKVFAWGYPGLVILRDTATRNFTIDSNEHVPPVVVTEGVVTTVIEPDDLHRLIIHTAEISPGNSGGPLVNERGELVGINTNLYVDEKTSKTTNNAIYAQNLIAFMESAGLEPRLARQEGGSTKVWWRTPSENIVRNTPEGELTPERILAMAAAGDVKMQLLAGIKYYLDEEGFEDENDEEAEYWLATVFNANQSFDAAAYYGMTLIGRGTDTAPLGLEYMAFAANAAILGLADSEYINNLADVLYRAERYHLPFNRVEAVKWAILAGDMGGNRGKALLANLLINNVDGRKQYARAQSLAMEVLAEDESNAEARAVQALALCMTGDMRQGRAQAIIAAEEGASLAMAILSWLHRTGEGAEQSWDLAREWGESAVFWGDPYGLAVMARYHAAGDEQSRDLVSARVHIRHAMNKAPFVEYQAFLSDIEALMTEDEMRRAVELEKRWLTEWGVGEYRPENQEDSGEEAEDAAAGEGGGAAE